ncbi:hypothetical protein D3C71_1708490 [compost metagenome]
MYLAISALMYLPASTLGSATTLPVSSIFLRNSGEVMVSTRAFFSLAAIGAGRPLGAIMANQELMSTFLNWGSSDSAGISGVMAERLASVVPSANTLPERMCGRPEDSTKMPYSMLLPTRSVVSGATPL